MWKLSGVGKNWKKRENWKMCGEGSWQSHEVI
jgi:hypothetical protein